jgi:hypothetical protein
MVEENSKFREPISIPESAATDIASHVALEHGGLGFSKISPLAASSCCYVASGLYAAFMLRAKERLCSQRIPKLQ